MAHFHFPSLRQAPLREYVRQRNKGRHKNQKNINCKQKQQHDSQDKNVRDVNLWKKFFTYCDDSVSGKKRMIKKQPKTI